MTTSALVKTVCGGDTSELLIQLTNQKGTATTITDSVLDACATMAEGRFRMETGITPDSAVDWHQDGLVKGTLYYLEFAKSRDQALISQREKSFLDAVRSIRAKVAISVDTDSPLRAVTQPANSKADLDRDGFVGGLTKGAGRVSRINDYSPSDDADVP